MITTVKNSRGYNIFISNLLISVICTCSVAYFGYSTGLRKRWFVQVGFAASFISLVHQMFLLSKRTAFTRLHNINIFMVVMCMLLLILSVLVPTLLTNQFSSMSKDFQSSATNLFISLALNFVPMILFGLSIFYKSSQVAQNYLHPFTEIIDGFAKSSGSIQMTSIPASNTLKEVVISTSEENQSKENVLLPKNKADGSSPRPSKVLKTWPKADPFPVRALYSFKPTSVSELPFKKGDTVTVLDCRGRWWQAQKDDRIGFIPSNYVAVLLKARVKSSFTASEDDQVSVKADEVVEVMEKYDERCLIRNVEDKIGAVPTDRLEFLSESEK